MTPNTTIAVTFKAAFIKREAFEALLAARAAMTRLRETSAALTELASQMPKRPKKSQRVRKPCPERPPRYLPEPGEVERQCLEIMAGWTMRKRINRRTRAIERGERMRRAAVA